MIRRRGFLAASGSITAVSVAGCLGSDDSSGIPVTVSNDDRIHHTVAILVTDELGNVDFFADTIRVKTGEQETFEERIPVPDSTPYPATARVLLDTGYSDNLDFTLDFDAEVAVEIKANDRIEHA